MTAPAPIRPRHPQWGLPRTPARLAVPLVAGLLLAACGPSPVDMVEHPVTTTPSRVAGEELQRSAEPDESCAAEPVPAEFAGAGQRRVASEGQVPDRVEVPRSPERILALGAGAVDVACALGLQDLVVGTSGLPRDADVFLPHSLVDLPDIPIPAGVAPGEVAAAARDLRPDLIVLADTPGRDPAVARELSEVAPTVVYDADVLRWTDATESISDAYGRPRAGGDVLLDVIDRARATTARTTPSDTQVSLVSIVGDTGDGVVTQDPDTLGSLMLEAVGAGRPPAQRTREGERIPPLPESPALGDELDGDVIFTVLGGSPESEEIARRVFSSDRWLELDAVGARRMFVVDRAVWEGAGPVAARAVLEDIANSINGIAPDG
ncbi:ABC transporter substrate-binding protein [Rhodococcus sp. IEGM 1408]|uniref:ABC transporter substrate-binding protein n=1 Tax=Rhodococcus sp. IEGM 1408 TaxID=3082220 RepID=UPI0029554633|nr:ABC transporter substrate-binding protein [Rhodococcus sp. IEGM 1408]MDV8000815.1 ABC transporter substrate-binding protein [Rhodococcus sp. IEGM 1408]